MKFEKWTNSQLMALSQAQLMAMDDSAYAEWHLAMWQRILLSDECNCSSNADAARMKVSAANDARLYMGKAITAEHYGKVWLLGSPEGYFINPIEEGPGEDYALACHSLDHAMRGVKQHIDRWEVDCMPYRVMMK